MSRLTISDKVYRIDPAAPTVASLQPGETVTVQVQNAFGKSFEALEEFEDFLRPENEAAKHAVNHPCTGPIEVITNGQDVSLAIEVVDMKVSRGYQCISRSTGLLKHRFPDRQCAIYDVDSDWSLRFRGGDLLMRGSPKLGFIATVDDEERSCGRCSRNGGNIDLNFIDKGATVYLPVNSSRARFLVGDLHICQGNGEAAGIAVEADGELKLRVSVVDKINYPVISHKHNLVVVGWGDTVDEALACSVENTISYLQRVFPFCDWDPGEIYKFISAEGNLTMGNSSGKVKTCGTVFFKRRLTNKFGFPVL